MNIRTPVVYCLEHRGTCQHAINSNNFLNKQNLADDTGVGSLEKQ